MTTRQAPQPETAERETVQPETAEPKAAQPETAEPGVVVHATDDTFEDVVLASNIPVLVDFWAQWCPPCHMMSPVLDEIAAELTGRLRVVKVDVDENPGVAQRYGILAMPTLSVFRDGEAVSSVVGARPKRRLLADLSEILLRVRLAAGGYRGGEGGEG
jgi:thioredoxin 1